MNSWVVGLVGIGAFLATPDARGAPKPPDPAPAPQAAEVPPPASTPVPVVTEYAVENGAVVAVQGAERVALALPSDVQAVHREGNQLYVARGKAGVSVYDITIPREPRLLREVATAGAHASGFHVADGELWVVVVTKSALPVSSLAAGPTAAAEGTSRAPSVVAPAPSKAQSRAPVAIVRVTPGQIELQGGARDGVRPGDRFAIFRATEEAGEHGSGFVGEELVAVATVVAVNEESALAEVGRGGEVRLSDEARPAKADQTESLMLPPQLPHVGEVSVVLRPLVNAGKPFGAGVLGDVEATYWGDAYFASLRLQPLGLGGTDDGSIVSTAALVEGGYEGQSFAVGLGIGMSWVNGNADYMLQNFLGTRAMADSSSDTPPRTERQETHSAFTLAQVARLGGRDGLNLSIHNVLLYHEDSEPDYPGEEAQSGFIYGGTSARLALPVSTRSDLFLEGGGGVMGYWFAGAGVSTWLTGNGVPGSWRLSVSAGGAGIWGSREITEQYPDATGALIPYTRTETIGVHGPMVAAGLLRRFAF